MGYRSSVAYWFRGNAAQAVVMEHMGEHPNQECFNELTITEDGVYFEAGAVKWYKGYHDVDWHDTLYALAASREDEGLSGQFVRIGEENDDIVEESFGDPWDDAACISICRSMDYTFPAK